MIHPRTTEAVNFTLDLLESHLIELRQRQLSEEQVDRFARLLEGAERFTLRLMPELVTEAPASLHSLRCTGPTRATGCVCRKIGVYQRTPVLMSTPRPESGPSTVRRSSGRTAEESGIQEVPDHG